MANVYTRETRYAGCKKLLLDGFGIVGLQVVRQCGLKCLSRFGIFSHSADSVWKKIASVWQVEYGACMLEHSGSEHHDVERYAISAYIGSHSCVESDASSRKGSSC